MSALRRSVLAADRAFFDALLAADCRALDALLAPDFAIVDVTAGGVTARDEFATGVASRAVRFASIETNPEDSLVRFYGDAAVVIGSTEMRLALPGGEILDVRSRYTHVFQRDAGGAWRLASAQGTRIAAS
jgi:ketosteroid isomerase-like protein